jgi:hypothetical protein
LRTERTRQLTSLVHAPEGSAHVQHLRTSRASRNPVRPSRPRARRPARRTRQGAGRHVVFGTAAALALIFLIYGALDPEGFGDVTGSVLGWITGNFGWLFVLTSGFFLIFSIYLAVTRYGNIRLGADDSEPEFSTFSWVSMMFATGMGIGLMFWGVAEPLTHLNTPPLGLADPATGQAAQLSTEYTFFHWGFHPWSMYAVIGLAIAYFAYRQGRGNLISSTFWPLLGDRTKVRPARPSTSSPSSPPSSARPPPSAWAPCRSPAASATCSASA